MSAIEKYVEARTMSLALLLVAVLGVVRVCARSEIEIAEAVCTAMQPLDVTKCVCGAFLVCGDSESVLEIDFPYDAQVSGTIRQVPFRWPCLFRSPWRRTARRLAF